NRGFATVTSDVSRGQGGISGWSGHGGVGRTPSGNRSQVTADRVNAADAVVERIGNINVSGGVHPDSPWISQARRRPSLPSIAAESGGAAVADDRGVGAGSRIDLTNNVSVIVGHIQECAGRVQCDAPGLEVVRREHESRDDAG